MTAKVRAQRGRKGKKIDMCAVRRRGGGGNDKGAQVLLLGIYALALKIPSDTSKLRSEVKRKQ
jgi:hypothetical protein